MRILHCADWHISTRHPRYATLCGALDKLALEADRLHPDAILVAGDIMELHPDAADVLAVQRWLMRFAGIAPVIVVRGNHDPLPWFPVLAQLDTLHSLTLVTEPVSLALLRPTGEPDEEEVCRLEHVTADMTNDVLGVISCLPWPAKGWLLSLLKEPCSSDETDQVTQDLLRQILQGFAAASKTWCPGVPSVLLAHLDVHGARMDSGQPSVGPGMRLGVEDLALAGADAIMLGHIHARQNPDAEPQIAYAGSPCRLTWGEAGAAEKGALLWSFEDGEANAVHIDVPSPRLWTVDAAWSPAPIEGGWAFIANPDDALAWLNQQRELGLIGPGDEVRYRYRVPEDQRKAAEAAMAHELQVIADCGIAPERVTVEAITLPTAHARAPEIASEQDPEQMFLRWIAAEGIEVPAARVERLRTLIHEAIQEVTP